MFGPIASLLGWKPPADNGTPSPPKGNNSQRQEKTTKGTLAEEKTSTSDLDHECAPASASETPTPDTGDALRSTQQPELSQNGVEHDQGSSSPRPIGCELEPDCDRDILGSRSMLAGLSEDATQFELPHDEEQSRVVIGSPQQIVRGDPHLGADRGNIGSGVEQGDRASSFPVLVITNAEKSRSREDKTAQGSAISSPKVVLTRLWSSDPETRIPGHFPTSSVHGTIETRNLVRDEMDHISATSRFQIPLDSHCKDRSELRRDEAGFATAALTTLIAQIGEWKKCPSTEDEGHVTISRKELEQLWSDLFIISEGSLVEEKEYSMTPLAAIPVAKHENSVKTGQTATASSGVARLQRELSYSDSRFADLQKRHEAALQELDSIRDEVHTLYPEGAVRVHGEISEKSTVDQLHCALEWKNKQMEELRFNFAASASQNAELQKSTEVLSKDVSNGRDELKEKTSQYQSAITSLAADAAKTEQIAAMFKQVEEFNHDLSASISQLSELRDRYEEQSHKFADICSELEARISFEETKDRTITTLATEVGQLKDADTNRAKQFATALQQVESLRQDLSTSIAQLADLHSRYEKQSHPPDLVPQPCDATKPTTTPPHHSRVMVLNDNVPVEFNTTIDNWLRADEELRRGLLHLKESSHHEQNHRRTEMQQRYEEQSKELKNRQSQLDSVQRFITTADAHADTAIAQMLQKLNAEVQQSTTYIAECVVESDRSPIDIATEEQMSVIQGTSEYIGQELTDSLRGEDVALCLQIAFQAYLSYRLYDVISSWTVQKENSDFIIAIYRQLQAKEAQTISGRWRSLTRSYISPTCLSDPHPLVASIVAGFSDIVTTAGYAAFVTELKLALESKVLSIISIAGQFSKMIGEVVSGDFEVMIVRPGEQFDEVTMEEDTDDYSGGNEVGMVGLKVLCSTQLGMTKRVPLESGERKTLTVTKTRVLFESFLDA